MGTYDGPPRLAGRGECPPPAGGSPGLPCSAEPGDTYCKCWSFSDQYQSQPPPSAELAAHIHVTPLERGRVGPRLQIGKKLVYTFQPSEFP